MKLFYQIKGKKPTKQNLKNKKLFNNNLSELLRTPIGVGGLIILTISSVIFGDISQVKAATPIAVNFDLAKEVTSRLSQASDTQIAQPVLAPVFVPEGYLSKPLITETQVTKEEPKKVVSKTSSQAKSALAIKKAAAEATPGRFPYGYCTYYASQRRFVPWSGNAISWLSGAQSYGFATGDTPQTGAIIVTSEGGKTGHVGIVDDVSDDQVTITEMNYHGWGVISSRTISAGYGRIMGYIY